MVCTANAPLTEQDFADFVKNNPQKLEELYLVAKYNNGHKGIIDEEFIKWAIDNSISYETIQWFLFEFSAITDEDIACIVDGIFNHYTMYYDESNNCLKFKFKNDSGELNTDYTEDFVLAGVAYEGDTPPVEIDSIFDKLKLQKNVIDVKLRHLIGKIPEDTPKFLHVLNSAKVETVLTGILEIENLYIHWSAINLLYFSLIDIVDSVLSYPMFHHEIKNVLYKYTLRDEDYILSLLARYKYPNVDRSKIKEYCFAMKEWIEGIEPDDEMDEFYLEYLRQELKASGRKGDIPFLIDNEDHVMIEGFAADYITRMHIFQGSTHVFDEISEVEDVLKCMPQKGEDVFKKADFCFKKSHDSKWLQLSDIIAGIMASYFTFANRISVEEFVPIIGRLTVQQKRNLGLLYRLMEKSTTKNKFFAKRSNVFSQEKVCILIERLAKYFSEKGELY